MKTFFYFPYIRKARSGLLPSFLDAEIRAKATPEPEKTRGRAMPSP